MTLSAFFFHLANHLWQSTLFVLGAAVLALALRNNAARARYWIWWVASVKFLIPFSLLVSVGSLFSWRVAPVAPAEASVSVQVLEQVTQPFSYSTVWTSAPVSAETPSGVFTAIPIVILACWFCGCGFMCLRWWSKWRRARALVWNARPAAFMTEGRELRMLRCLERKVGARKPLTIVPSGSSIEPSVFGLFRPVLVWPAGLSARLTDEELEAILLHELSHGRRRDNLTAALHMVVEAVFWFHPLVWWIGVRLIDEREKACDEDVLRWGGASQVYAEGILKVCEFCLESPLVCAAGVTGSDLKRRIEGIARNRVVDRLSFGVALLLAGVPIMALVAPVAIGALRVDVPGRSEGAIRTEPPRSEPSVQVAQAQTPRLEPRTPQNPVQHAPDLLAEIRAILAPQSPETFEVVSIRVSTGAPGGGRGRGGPGQRGGGPAGPTACGGINPQVNPGRFVATNMTLYRLITLAYGKNCRLSTEQTLLTGGPDWLQSVAYDIEAIIPAGAPSYSQRQLVDGEAPGLQKMLQNMLADRFGLTLHRETKEVPIYELVLAQMGRVKLSEDQTPVPPPPPGPPVRRDPTAPIQRGDFGMGVNPPEGIVRIWAKAIPISQIVNSIQGDVGRMIVDKTEPKGLYDIPEVELNVGPYDIGPGAVTVWPEIMRQLGLRMDPTRGPAEVLVIDGAEKPSEN